MNSKADVIEPTRTLLFTFSSVERAVLLTFSVVARALLFTLSVVVRTLLFTFHTFDHISVLVSAYEAVWRDIT
jgi:hypothetical protein